MAQAASGITSFRTSDVDQLANLLIPLYSRILQSSSQTSIPFYTSAALSSVASLNPLLESHITADNVSLSVATAMPVSVRHLFRQIPYFLAAFSIISLAATRSSALFSGRPSFASLSLPRIFTSFVVPSSVRQIIAEGRATVLLSSRKNAYFNESGESNDNSAEQKDEQLKALLSTLLSVVPTHLASSLLFPQISALPPSLPAEPTDHRLVHVADSNSVIQQLRQHERTTRPHPSLFIQVLGLAAPLPVLSAEKDGSVTSVAPQETQPLKYNPSSLTTGLSLMSLSNYLVGKDILVQLSEVSAALNTLTSLLSIRHSMANTSKEERDLNSIDATISSHVRNELYPRCIDLFGTLLPSSQKKQKNKALSEQLKRKWVSLSLRLKAGPIWGIIGPSLKQRNSSSMVLIPTSLCGSNLSNAFQSSGNSSADDALLFGDDSIDTLATILQMVIWILDKSNDSSQMQVAELMESEEILRWSSDVVSTVLGLHLSSLSSPEMEETIACLTSSIHKETLRKSQSMRTTSDRDVTAAVAKIIAEQPIADIRARRVFVSRLLSFMLLKQNKSRNSQFSTRNTNCIHSFLMNSMAFLSRLSKFELSIRSEPLSKEIAAEATKIFAPLQNVTSRQLYSKMLNLIANHIISFLINPVPSKDSFHISSIIQCCCLLIQLLGCSKEVRLTTASQMQIGRKSISLKPNVQYGTGYIAYLVAPVLSQMVYGLAASMELSNSATQIDSSFFREKISSISSLLTVASDLLRLHLLLPSSPFDPIRNPQFRLEFASSALETLKSEEMVKDASSVIRGEWSDCNSPLLTLHSDQQMASPFIKKMEATTRNSYAEEAAHYQHAQVTVRQHYVTKVDLRPEVIELERKRKRDARMAGTSETFRALGYDEETDLFDDESPIEEPEKWRILDCILKNGAIPSSSSVSATKMEQKSLGKGKLDEDSEMSLLRVQSRKLPSFAAFFSTMKRATSSFLSVTSVISTLESVISFSFSQSIGLEEIVNSETEKSSNTSSGFDENAIIEKILNSQQSSHKHRKMNNLSDNLGRFLQESQQLLTYLASDECIISFPDFAYSLSSALSDLISCITQCNDSQNSFEDREIFAVEASNNNEKDEYRMEQDEVQPQELIKYHAPLRNSSIFSLSIPQAALLSKEISVPSTFSSVPTFNLALSMLSLVQSHSITTSPDFLRLFSLYCLCLSVGHSLIGLPPKIVASRNHPLTAASAVTASFFDPYIEMYNEEMERRKLEQEKDNILIFMTSSGKHVGKGQMAQGGNGMDGAIVVRDMTKENQVTSIDFDGSMGVSSRLVLEKGVDYDTHTRMENQRRKEEEEEKDTFTQYLDYYKQQYVSSEGQLAADEGKPLTLPSPKNKSTSADSSSTNESSSSSSSSSDSSNGKESFAVDKMAPIIARLYFSLFGDICAGEYGRFGVKRPSSDLSRILNTFNWKRNYTQNNDRQLQHKLITMMASLSKDASSFSEIAAQLGAEKSSEDLYNFLVLLTHMPEWDDHTYESLAADDDEIEGKAQDAQSAASSAAKKNFPVIPERFNFYTDSLPSEATLSALPFQLFLTRVQQLLRTYPDHPSLLKMSSLASDLLAISQSSPLAQLSAGVETLIRLSEDWNHVQQSGPASLEHEQQLMLSLAMRWRHIESRAWRAKLIEMEEAACFDGKATMLFQLYSHAFVNGPLGNIAFSLERENESNKDDGTLSSVISITSKEGITQTVRVSALNIQKKKDQGEANGGMANDNSSKHTIQQRKKQKKRKMGRFAEPEDPREVIQSNSDVSEEEANKMALLSPSACERWLKDFFTDISLFIESATLGDFAFRVASLSAVHNDLAARRQLASQLLSASLSDSNNSSCSSVIIVLLRSFCCLSDRLLIILTYFIDSACRYLPLRRLVIDSQAYEFRKRLRDQERITKYDIRNYSAFDTSKRRTRREVNNIIHQYEEMLDKSMQQEVYLVIRNQRLTARLKSAAAFDMSVDELKTGLQKSARKQKKAPVQSKGWVVLPSSSADHKQSLNIALTQSNIQLSRILTNWLKVSKKFFIQSNSKKLSLSESKVLQSTSDNTAVLPLFPFMSQASAVVDSFAIAVFQYCEYFNKTTEQIDKDWRNRMEIAASSEDRKIDKQRAVRKVEKELRGKATNLKPMQLKALKRLLHVINTAGVAAYGYKHSEDIWSDEDIWGFAEQKEKALNELKEYSWNAEDNAALQKTLGSSTLFRSLAIDLAGSVVRSTELSADSSLSRITAPSTSYPLDMEDVNLYVSNSCAAISEQAKEDTSSFSVTQIQSIPIDAQSSTQSSQQISTNIVSMNEEYNLPSFLFEQNSQSIHPSLYQLIQTANSFFIRCSLRINTLRNPEVTATGNLSQIPHARTLESRAEGLFQWVLTERARLYQAMSAALPTVSSVQSLVARIKGSARKVVSTQNHTQDGSKPVSNSFVTKLEHLLQHTLPSLMQSLSPLALIAEKASSGLIPLHLTALTNSTSSTVLTKDGLSEVTADETAADREVKAVKDSLNQLCESIKHILTFSTELARRVNQYRAVLPSNMLWITQNERAIIMDRFVIPLQTELKVVKQISNECLPLIGSENCITDVVEEALSYLSAFTDCSSENHQFSISQSEVLQQTDSIASSLSSRPVIASILLCVQNIFNAFKKSQEEMASKVIVKSTEETASGEEEAAKEETPILEETPDYDEYDVVDFFESHPSALLVTHQTINRISTIYLSDAIRNDSISNLIHEIDTSSAIPDWLVAALPLLEQFIHTTMATFYHSFLFHSSLCKFAHVLSSLALSLSINGLCHPQENIRIDIGGSGEEMKGGSRADDGSSEGAGGESSEAMGMSEGQGDRDISSSIENEKELLAEERQRGPSALNPLTEKEEDEQKKEKQKMTDQEKEDLKKGFDIEMDFGGEMNDIPEDGVDESGENKGEKQQGATGDQQEEQTKHLDKSEEEEEDGKKKKGDEEEEEEEEDLDAEMGGEDNFNPDNILDERLWNENEDEEEDEDEDEKKKSKPIQSGKQLEQAEDEEDNPDNEEAEEDENNEIDQTETEFVDKTKNKNKQRNTKQHSKDKQLRAKFDENSAIDDEDRKPPEDRNKDENEEKPEEGKDETDKADDKPLEGDATEALPEMEDVVNVEDDLEGAENASAPDEEPGEDDGSAEKDEKSLFLPGVKDQVPEMPDLENLQFEDAGDESEEEEEGDENKEEGEENEKKEGGEEDDESKNHPDIEDGIVKTEMKESDEDILEAVEKPEEKTDIEIDETADEALSKPTEEGEEQQDKKGEENQEAKGEEAEERTTEGTDMGGEAGEMTSKEEKKKKQSGAAPGQKATDETGEENDGTKQESASTRSNRQKKEDEDDDYVPIERDERDEFPSDSSSSSENDNNGMDDSANQAEINPLRKMGDPSKSWKQKLRMIKGENETNEQEKHHQERSNDQGLSYQYEIDEEAEDKMNNEQKSKDESFDQTLGPATSEQIKKSKQDIARDPHTEEDNAEENIEESGEEESKQQEKVIAELVKTNQKKTTRNNSDSQEQNEKEKDQSAKEQDTNDSEQHDEQSENEDVKQKERKEVESRKEAQKKKDSSERQNGIIARPIPSIPQDEEEASNPLSHLQQQQTQKMDLPSFSNIQIDLVQHKATEPFSLSKEKSDEEDAVIDLSTPTTEQKGTADEIWQHILVSTSDLSTDLSEQLRLILAPTHASRARGEFRTGRRLNMRRVIPYIASHFRKDKIWMRKTTPDKRKYHVLIAIDDSRSMRELDAGLLALQSMAMLCRSLTHLEAGQVAVASFGSTVRTVLPFDQPFNEGDGSSLVSQFTFAQNETKFELLMQEAVNIMAQADSQGGGASGTSNQIMFIISDGRITKEFKEIRQWVSTATAKGIFVVFLIIDCPSHPFPSPTPTPTASSSSASPAPRFSPSPVPSTSPSPSPTPTPSPSHINSIVKTKRVIQEGGRTKLIPVLDLFPFPYYIVLRDLSSLPRVLGDSLRQWFEMMEQKG